MCLAAPAKIIRRSGLTATAETDGVRREVHLGLLPEVQVGDFVLVHAGFAIQRWTQEDLDEYLSLQQELESTL
ncbi:MAG: HypC/HybG/HupF family hydrogenase formation chaperone [candidate division FCPU426 bacterium]